MGELHALYDTRMARLGSSTRKIGAALSAGRNVLLFYIDWPPELAMAGIISSPVSRMAAPISWLIEKSADPFRR
jgi:hypothetical protein